MRCRFFFLLLVFFSGLGHSSSGEHVRNVAAIALFSAEAHVPATFIVRDTKELSLSEQKRTPCYEPALCRFGHTDHMRPAFKERMSGWANLPEFYYKELILSSRFVQSVLFHNTSFISFLRILLYPKHSFW